MLTNLCAIAVGRGAPATPRHGECEHRQRGDLQRQRGLGHGKAFPLGHLQGGQPRQAVGRASTPTALVTAQRPGDPRTSPLRGGSEARAPDLADGTPPAPWWR